MIDTITPENGIKEHIIVEGVGIFGIAVACGHDRFDRETGEVTQYDSYEEINEAVLCMNCKKRYEEDKEYES